MAKLIYLTLGIIIIIQFSSFIIERGKLYFSNEMGYEGSYSNSIGRISFINPKMQDSFKAVSEEYQDDPKKYLHSVEWQLLIIKDRKDRAKIELSGKLITFLISSFGLGTYFFRRSKNQEMSWIDWLGVIFGLVFMREVLINSINLIMQNMLCQEAKFWQQMDLPVFKSTAIYTFFGVLLFLYVVYRIPKENRMEFIASGLIGTIIGGILWLFFLGDLML